MGDLQGAVMRRLFPVREDERPLPYRVVLSFVALWLAFTFSTLALAGGIIANQHRIEDIQKVRAAMCKLTTNVSFRRQHPDLVASLSDIDC